MDKPPRRPRLFAGIALDDATRARCAQIAARLEAQGFAARYEAPEKLHVTLAFLGNVEHDRVADAEIALAQAVRGCERFTLVLDKVGAFPNERRPRVVYVGARDQGMAFRDLASRVRERYAALGYAFEDDIVAHVTIARVKRDERSHALPLLDVEPIPLAVDRVVLFESVPHEHSTRYEIRTESPLPSS